ncbi:MAG: amidohydrolase family protein [Deltaproteobacteria bacterium]|nr:amidohydrolase family protein [Deltaproteobacteria bacterium]
MKLGSGIAAVARMLEKGLTVGLGTDGCAYNNDLDLFGEMDTAAKLAKVANLDPTVLDARSVLKMATMPEACSRWPLSKVPGSLDWKTGWELLRWEKRPISLSSIQILPI